MYAVTESLSGKESTRVNNFAHVNYKKSISISDRHEAIKTACSIAKPGDILLIAGKGHEKYQEIKGVKYPFDDMQVLQENLKLFEK